MAERVFDRKVFYRGQRIFAEGDRGNCMYFVERGRVAISKGPEGAEEPLGEIATGGIFGEMALIDGAPRMAHATAAEECVIHAIPQAMFEQKMNAADPFLRAVLRILLTNYRAALQRQHQNAA